jgi:hypothetical protein
MFIFVFMWLTTSCAPTPTPTPFRPPTKSLSTQILPTTTPVPQLFTPAPETATPLTPTKAVSCFNNLDFIEDATIPDGTVVGPATVVDKQWVIANSGTCSWDAGYRLKLIGGDALGAAEEQALYPARAGTQITLRIFFTAPLDTGTYESTWQAYGPDGVAFGDQVYMEIVVE